MLGCEPAIAALMCRRTIRVPLYDSWPYPWCKPFFFHFMFQRLTYKWSRHAHIMLLCQPVEAHCITKCSQYIVLLCCSMEELHFCECTKKAFSFCRFGAVRVLTMMRIRIHGHGFRADKLLNNPLHGYYAVHEDEWCFA